MIKGEKYKLIIIFILIILITILHYFTPFDKWGFHEFYRRLYYIPIILSAFKFRLKGGVISAVAVSTLYAPHLLFYWGSINIGVLNQFLEIILFISVGLITGLLVEKHHVQQELLKYQIQKLIKMENYTNSILNSIVNGVIAVDNKGTITSFNREASNLFTLTKQNAKGKSIDKVIGNKNLKNWVKKVYSTGKVLMKKIEIKAKPIKLYIYPLKITKTKTEGAVLVCEDLTEIKELESQVRRADRLSAIGEFASGIAHELRNPLAIIKTVSESLKEYAHQNEELREAIIIINEEIARADAVIKELLNFARPGKNKKINFYLTELLKEVLLLTRKYAKQHGVIIQSNLPHHNIYVNGDPETIKQAFINVILNGIQAIKHGGVININYELRSKSISIIIEDTGCGIDEELKDKIFNPFFTTRDEGTGLGLTITHQIIEEHGGSIEVQSRKNIGSKFIITLPIVRSDKTLESFNS